MKVLAVLRELVADQKKQNEMMLDNQRKFCDQMLKIRKAEKREFLNIWAAHLNVNTSGAEIANNTESSHPPLIYKEFDLMTLYAPEKPSILGRELARRLFGVGEKCELVLLIIGKKNSRETGRKPCDDFRYQLFKGLVWYCVFLFSSKTNEYR